MVIEQQVEDYSPILFPLLFGQLFTAPEGEVPLDQVLLAAVLEVMQLITGLSTSRDSYLPTPGIQVSLQPEGSADCTSSLIPCLPCPLRCGGLLGRG